MSDLQRSFHPGHSKEERWMEIEKSAKKYFKNEYKITIIEAFIWVLKENGKLKTKVDPEIKERREKQVEKLIEIKNWMAESEELLSMKEIYEAIIAGGMALQRLNEIDFPNGGKINDERKRNSGDKK